ncbi:hypothetical protein [Lentzea cavernae]|uniref:Uncharacterized protein n=1 Tax=Lentzea cavernae TaxID=2020703 RepID=A0ABQ3MBH7_9PSEU|nr:hypothetical protein [Lentzea cavernae]GHH38583.1 hypothetical protein GCM10017774_28730 [Lentzea cavernae]
MSRPGDRGDEIRQQAEIDAEVAASADALSRAPGDARDRALDRREEQLDELRRGLDGREAELGESEAAQRRRGAALDDREQLVRQRDADADQREINMQTALPSGEQPT